VGGLGSRHGLPVFPCGERGFGAVAGGPGYRVGRSRLPSPNRASIAQLARATGADERRTSDGGATATRRRRDFLLLSWARRWGEDSGSLSTPGCTQRSTMMRCARGAHASCLSIVISNRMAWQASLRATKRTAPAQNQWPRLGPRWVGGNKISRLTTRVLGQHMTHISPFWLSATVISRTRRPGG
jgi:hypothetical protein